jgi:hypothetical protein
MGQKQLPLTHIPLSEQSSGQLFEEQSAPVQPSWQLQRPNTVSHAPWSLLVQSFKHDLDSQASPK